MYIQTYNENKNQPTASLVVQNLTWSIISRVKLDSTFNSCISIDYSRHNQESEAATYKFDAHKMASLVRNKLVAERIKSIKRNRLGAAAKCQLG